MKTIAVIAAVWLTASIVGVFIWHWLMTLDFPIDEPRRHRRGVRPDMIDADSITFTDGTAWWVTDLDTFTDWEDDYLDRPCDTCQGTEWSSIVETDDGDFIEDICPDCSGTGRHTFEIETRCPMHLGGCERNPIRYRVSIVPGVVLPIVARYVDDAAHAGPHICYDAEHGHMIGMDYQQHLVALPPAAEPGMFAVQLRVAS